MDYGVYGDLIIIIFYILKGDYSGLEFRASGLEFGIQALNPKP